MKTTSRKIKSTPATAPPDGNAAPESGATDALTRYTPHRILVATDFSDASNAALAWAAGLARRAECPVVLLHVLEPPPRWVGLESAMLLQSGDATVGRVYAAMDALSRRHFEEKVSVESHVRTGKPFHEIVKAAEEMSVDLIVIASRGRGGMRKALLGSTAERVARHSTCPVLVVRDSGGAAPFEGRARAGVSRILYPTDLSPGSEAALPAVLGFAEILSAQVTLLHVMESSVSAFELNPDSSVEFSRYSRTVHRALDDLAGRLKRHGIKKVGTAVESGSPRERILKTAAATGATLVVMGTHGRTGLKHVYLGSVAESVMRQAGFHILTVPQKDPG